jgi:hypothetical protein
MRTVANVAYSPFWHWFELDFLAAVLSGPVLMVTLTYQAIPVLEEFFGRLQTKK